MPVKQVLASVIAGVTSLVLTAANEAFRRAMILKELDERPLIKWLATSSFIDVSISLLLVIIMVLIWVPYIIQQRAE